MAVGPPGTGAPEDTDADDDDGDDDDVARRRSNTDNARPYAVRPSVFSASVRTVLASFEQAAVVSVSFNGSEQESSSPGIEV